MEVVKEGREELQGMKWRLRMAVQRVGSGEVWVSALNYIVFAICGGLDKLLCPVFRFLDWQVDQNAAPCHCAPHPSALRGDGGGVYNALDFWKGPSHTLYERGGRRDARVVSFVARWRKSKKPEAVAKSERLRPTCWSDCGCQTCTAWLTKENLLYVHADCKGLLFVFRRV